MELNILLALAVIFLGVVIGAVIAHFCKEEIKKGRNYFRILLKIILVLILIVFLYFKGIANKDVLLIELSLVFMFCLVLGSLLYCRHINKNNA